MIMKLKLKNYFENLRKDFPILKEKIRGRNLIYVDNAATTQKPQIIIDSLVNYYSKYNSNVHRGIHTLSERATEEFERVRDKVADFIYAKREEIVFTSGTTESINIVAAGLEDYIQKGDEILLSEVEHHANLVPWQVLAKKNKAKLVFFTSKDFNNKLSSKTKLVAFPHISNVTGEIFPVKEMVNKAKKVGALSLIDAAQSTPCMVVDVKDLKCDFLVFSAHKMCGPTGVGILYGNKLNLLKPRIYGGSMIDDVSYDNSTYNKVPYCFEAGTPNIAGVIAFGFAIDYLKKIGMEKIEEYEKELIKYFLGKIKKLDVEIIGSREVVNRASIFTLYFNGLHAIDVAALLDRKGIAVRSGQHCASPYHKKLKKTATTRVSLYFYNTFEEIDMIISELEYICKKFT